MRIRSRIQFVVFALSLLLTLCAAAQTPWLVPDAIFFNGKIVTVDAGFKIQQAFAIKGESFVAVGSNAEIKKLAGKETKMIDLKGSTVVPGLSDCHDHLFNIGRYTWRGVDMWGVKSVEELQNRLRPAVAAAKPGEIVHTTLGWSSWKLPTRQDLDAVSSTVPIMLITQRRGVSMYNSAALKLFGITKEHPSYAGIHAKVDESGEPTGLAPEYPASVMIPNKFIPMTKEEEEEVIIKGWQQRNSFGITQIRELSLWPDGMDAWMRVWRKGKLTGRASLGLEFPDQENTLKHIEALHVIPPFGDHWLKVESQGEEPWASLFPNKQDYINSVIELNRLGWRPAHHTSADMARGIDFDAATNPELEADEAADRDSSIKDKRWFIEHVYFATPDQIDRMAKLKLIVSVQDAGWYGVQPNWMKDPKRIENVNPLRTYLDKGVVLIGGSDINAPYPGGERYSDNPFIMISFYVTRKSREGQVFGAAQKITREEALRIFTINPAYAEFDEKIRGSIEAGKLADFVVLSQDLMTVPEDQIIKTKALATYVGGKKVYSAQGVSF